MRLRASRHVEYAFWLRQADRQRPGETDRRCTFCDVGQCKALALVCCARRLDARLAFYRARASCLGANDVHTCTGRVVHLMTHMPSLF